MTEVKIWHDGDENIMQTIADCANEKLAEDNIKVTFEKKSGLTDQLQLYGNDESNGPDMYLCNQRRCYGRFTADDGRGRQL